MHCLKTSPYREGKSIALSATKKRRCRLLLAMLFIFSLPALAQPLITLNVKKEKLETILVDIKKQTGYGLVYDNDLLAQSRPVTASFTNAPIKKVLDHCFRSQPLTYRVIEQVIVVTSKDKQLTGSQPPVIDTIVIKGTVVNSATGDPLPGVSVVEKGTTNTAVTDAGGLFVLFPTKTTSVIRFSSIGYLPQEITARQSVNVSIKLTPEEIKLDEVQIIGYGTTTRRFNTGAVSKVTASEISKQPVSNPLAALQGRASGLVVTQTTGLPGSNYTVQIRGKNSLSQGTEPLYIIDGVPFAADNLAQFNSTLTTSPFNTLNPDDIESIEVLKDADATAIYGSRGANGVILITTKRAKEGGLSAEANYQTGWGTATQKSSLLNTPQYLAMRRQTFKNDGVTPSVARAPDLLVWDTARYTDWQDFFIGNTARLTTANFKISGGNDYARVALNIGHYNETTVFPTDHGAKRISADLYATVRSKNDRFQVDANVNYAVHKNKLMGLGSQIMTGTTLPPNYPALTDSAGNLRFSEKGVSFTNPLAVLRQFYNGETRRLTASVIPVMRITRELSAKVNLGYNTTDFSEVTGNPIAAQNPAFNPTAYANFGSATTNSWIAEPQVEYNTRLGNQHRLQLLAGGTWQQLNNSSQQANIWGINNDDLLFSIAAAAPANTSIKNAASIYTYNAFFGRANYRYADRYVLNLTARRDGSSRFGPNRRFANFGAIGAVWIVTAEKWMQKLKPVLSFGRLRAGWGTTGNDQIGDYKYLDTWQPSGTAYDNQTSLSVTQLYNNNYSWERTTKWDLAADLGFYHDRVLVGVNWYRNSSGNQLINYALPSQTGFGGLLINFPAVVENTGWELELTSTNFSTRHFKWTTSINLTIPKNRLRKFPGLESSTYASSYVIGKPVTIQWGYSYQGIDPQTGIYSYADLNGDGALNQADYVVIGKFAPSYYGGINNSFSYRGFTLDLFFQFTRQHGRSALASIPAGTYRNIDVRFLDSWKNPGDNTTYQRYTQQSGAATTARTRLSSSTAVYTNASFIRLKNTAVSYTLNPNWLRRYGLQSLAVFCQAQNLLNITPYRGGDPEIQSSLALPPLRMITLGFKIKI